MMNTGIGARNLACTCCVLVLGRLARVFFSTKQEPGTRSPVLLDSLRLSCWFGSLRFVCVPQLNKRTIKTTLKPRTKTKKKTFSTATQCVCLLLLCLSLPNVVSLLSSCLALDTGMSWLSLETPRNYFHTVWKPLLLLLMSNE